MGYLAAFLTALLLLAPLSEARVLEAAKDAGKPDVGDSSKEDANAAASDKEEDKATLPAAWATALGAAVSGSTGSTAVDEHPSENPTPTPTETAPESTPDSTPAADGKVKSFKGSLKHEKVARQPKENVPKSTLPTDVPAEQPLVESKTIDVFGNEAWSTCPDLQSSLDWTNYYRSLHGAAPLRWSNNLAISAQNVANTCAFQHSYGPFGENLAWGGWDNMGTCTQAVSYWYNQEVGIWRNGMDFTMATGHFTQLVWKGTTDMGCAITNCGITYIVCQYWPPGNVLGQAWWNVQERGW